MRSLDTRGVAMLLEELNRKCPCEIGEPHPEDCCVPIDRWWLRWGRDQSAERAA